MMYESIKYVFDFFVNPIRIGVFPLCSTMGKGPKDPNENFWFWGVYGTKIFDFI